MKIRLFTAFAFLIIINNAKAQQNENLPYAEKNAVIDTLVAKINTYYVYADVAKKITDAIRQHQENHAYDAIANRMDFASLLTKQLKEISKDGHLGVEFSNEPIKQNNYSGPSEADIAAFRSNGARNNYNFHKVERLEGNIGYLELNAFYPAGWIKETAAGAMSFLSNADAIIIDMRNNHGFAPDGVLLVESYFFKEATHITDQIDRDAKTTRQYWTMPVESPQSLADEELYILTSKNTFSAGEDFAYNMQAQGRAKIIGESTGGGAHGTKPYPIGNYFMASIPFSYSVNPVTHGDWEGVGVKPDVSVPANKALLTAQIMAIRSLIKRIASEKKRVKQLEVSVTKLELELNEQP